MREKLLLLEDSRLVVSWYSSYKYTWYESSTLERKRIVLSRVGSSEVAQWVRVPARQDRGSTARTHSGMRELTLRAAI